MKQLINISEIKTLYPDEWVSIGNPVMDDSKMDVLSGVPLRKITGIFNRITK